jgi:hypothetical protein
MPLLLGTIQYKKQESRRIKPQQMNQLAFAKTTRRQGEKCPTQKLKGIDTRILSPHRKFEIQALSTNATSAASTARHHHTQTEAPNSRLPK